MCLFSNGFPQVVFYPTLAGFFSKKRLNSAICVSDRDKPIRPDRQGNVPQLFVMILSIQVSDYHREVCLVLEPDRLGQARLRIQMWVC
jgi:hypothetical protein